MTEREFCYWVQGFVEMNPNAMVTHTQWEIIKDHLKLVFKKETPDRLAVQDPKPAPFPSYPPVPVDRAFPSQPEWTPPKPFTRPAWMLPDTPWPPTVIC